MSTWTRHLYENDPLAISKGESKGLSVRNIFGYQEDVTTSFIPAWEYATAYTYPTSAVTMDVASTDTVNDNGYTVRIIGLDENYDIISEDVIIPATTTKAFFRINDILYFNTDGNQGLITVSNGGTVYAAIRIGDGSQPPRKARRLACPRSLGDRHPRAPPQGAAHRYRTRTRDEAPLPRGAGAKGPRPWPAPRPEAPPYQAPRAP